MANTIFLVDLPNFYSRLLKSRLENSKLLKEYFMNWLDFDLLANDLAKPHNGMWVFYSGERIGPSSERIEGKFLQEYIRRINTQEGVTAWNVNIPGEQREPMSYTCENCGHQGSAQALSEKGIDASLTVHLFDTMDSWDLAYLLSGDADFVPAVSSLRRRGKIVIGVGFPDASPALVRECYKYIDISQTYLAKDFLLFLLFRKGGIANQWLTDDVISEMPQGVQPKELVYRVYWGNEYIERQDDLIRGHRIRFTADAGADLSKRIAIFQKLKSQFPQNISFDIDKINDRHNINVSVEQDSVEAIDRNVSKVLEGNDNKLIIKTLPHGGRAIFAKYEYDENEHQYYLVKEPPK